MPPLAQVYAAAVVANLVLYHKSPIDDMPLVNADKIAAKRLFQQFERFGGYQAAPITQPNLGIVAVADEAHNVIKTRYLLVVESDKVEQWIHECNFCE